MAWFDPKKHIQKLLEIYLQVDTARRDVLRPVTVILKNLTANNPTPPVKLKMLQYE
jgi:hypothetical protein